MRFLLTIGLIFFVVVDGLLSNLREPSFEVFDRVLYLCYESVLSVEQLVDVDVAICVFEIVFLYGMVGRYPPEDVPSVLVVVEIHAVDVSCIELYPCLLYSPHFVDDVLEYRFDLVEVVAYEDVVNGFVAHCFLSLFYLLCSALNPSRYTLLFAYL